MRATRLNTTPGNPPPDGGFRGSRHLIIRIRQRTVYQMYTTLRLDERGQKIALHSKAAYEDK